MERGGHVMGEVLSSLDTPFLTRHLKGGVTGKGAGRVGLQKPPT